MTTFHKGLYKWLIAASSVALLPSCSKSFLHEEQITSVTSDEYKTQDGIDKLVIGMYLSYRYPFNSEWGYGSLNFGTDEFAVGGAVTVEPWNTYSINSQSIYINSTWDAMYSAINTANIVIQNTPVYYTPGTGADTRLGEGYFTRAWAYFNLVTQYGGVPLKLTPSTTVEYEFTRAAAKDIYAQIISDFTKAYEVLPKTAEANGRITKWAAGHFLAKAYLTRASELYDDWNSATKQDDLNKAVTYSTDVISNSGRSLAPNFSDLWNYTGPDGANESLSEVLLAAQFNDNLNGRDRYGNQMHLFFLSVYQGSDGMVRDIPGGREYSRLRTTDYLIDIYDRQNDSRFWKSFRTVINANNPASIPKWTDTYAPSPELVGTPKYAGNEPAWKYIVNDAGDTRFTADNIGYNSAQLKVRYYSGESANYPAVNHGGYSAAVFPALSKFTDGSRETVASTFGNRDGILARLGETYLIAAEAYGRLGNYNTALTYINTLRDRAAYKAGEDRSAYVDGGVSYKNNSVANTAQYTTYSNKNSYYESNDIEVSTAATSLHLNSVNDMFNSKYEFYDKLTSSSDADKFIQFILNERSRELAGELLRWQDLARTKTLVKRAKAFNDTALPLESKNYVRPIPQTFLDMVQLNGKSLTNEQKQAMQNPNY
ncbi:Starch-binding associating with outer membrane [Filimonas lacunae]|uniref:Starch-binding associating with outer membrane n=1 Tax=Filimonas lacunae TaxID=477680 RepID=A0A173MN03_9BACT|nr:RagB/SusD family nutrient uptake outer membrane protein [Filimonas lacunae]BAV08866.1 outer membrane protein, nutrient binding [Filimonas lacunae]SIS63043.1 Starch-binding associating with outer membrane [Filimonas lacunae]